VNLATITGYADAYPIYQDYGWAAIKLEAGTKWPPPAGFTGNAGKVPDDAQMRRWAADEPGGNLALRLPPDMIGIDIDAHSGKTGAATKAEAEKRWGKLPYSPRSTSRDDGVSGIMLYRIPPGMKLVDELKFPELGIEHVDIIQHHHRYVVAWPSIHQDTGAVYRWLGIDGGPLDYPPAPMDIPDLPAAWLDGLRPRQREADTTPAPPSGGSYRPAGAVPDAYAEAARQQELAALAATGAGGRNKALNNAALKLARLPIDRDLLHADLLDACHANGYIRDDGIDAAEATIKSAFGKADLDGPRPIRELSAVTEVPAAHFSGHQQPPQQAHHVDNGHPARHEQESAEERQDADPAAIAERLITIKMDVLRIDREARRRLDAEERPRLDLPPVKSLPALLDEPDEDTPWLIDKVMQADTRVMLAAQFKSGKTTIVENLVRALADQSPFLGAFEVKHAPSAIVLIDDELSERMLRRWLREQGVGNTAAVADVVSLRGRVGSLNLLDEHIRAEWAARLRELRCDFLILDCLRPILDALGLDENRDAGKFLTAFDAMLADAGITSAVMVDHMGHSGERNRGDSRKLDWPDATWKLVREDEQPDSARFFSAYGRDVDVFEGRLAYEPATRRLTYVQGSRSDTKVRAAFVDVVRLLAAVAKDDPQARGEDRACLTKSAIEAELRHAGYKENTDNGGHSQKAVRAAIDLGLRSAVLRVVPGPRRSQLVSIAHPCEECGLPVAGQQSRHESCPADVEAAPE
jgi:hypothetical protein